MDTEFIELYEKLSRLQWLLQRHQIQNHQEHGPMADPTRGQGRVLAMLKIQPEISSKDLSYLLGIRQQSLNELLNKLEKSGHITREPSEKDRRVMMVKLTEKGKNEKQGKIDINTIFDCLDEDELMAFSGYLDRIISALEAQVGDIPGEEEWFRAMENRMGEDGFNKIREIFEQHQGHPHHHHFGGRKGFFFGGGQPRPPRPHQPNRPDEPKAPSDPYNND